MKIFRLFIDENIKIWKKLSTKLLIIAVLLSLVGVLGLTKLMQHMDERNKMSVYVTENNDEYLKSEIDYLKEQLKDENLDEESKKSMQAQMEQYEMYLQYDIQLYGDTWKNDIVKSIVKLRLNGKNDEAEKLVQILKNNDYSGYIANEKKILKDELDNKEIKQQEYDDEILILELKEEYLKEDEETWKKSIIREIQNSQKGLREGISYNSGKLLKVEDKQKLEELITMDKYRLEKNIEPIETSSDENFRLRFEMLE